MGLSLFVSRQLLGLRNPTLKVQFAPLGRVQQDAQVVWGALRQLHVAVDPGPAQVGLDLGADAPDGGKLRRMVGAIALEAALHLREPVFELLVLFWGGRPADFFPPLPLLFPAVKLRAPFGVEALFGLGRLLPELLCF